MLRIPHQCEKLYRHHRMILVVALVASVIGAWLSLKLPLRSDLDELLPDSFPSVHAMNRMRQEVGGSGRLRLVLEAPSFESMTRLAHDLEPRLAASPFVQYVDYQNNVGFYRTHALLFLEPDELDSLRQAIQDAIDSRKQELNPFMVDDLFGESETESGSDELAAWEEKYQTRGPTTPMRTARSW